MTDGVCFPAGVAARREGRPFGYRLFSRTVCRWGWMKTKYAVPVYVWLVACLFGAQACAGQTCRTDIAVSTPTGSFEFHENGTLTHKDTGLMWMRCALGQTWNGRGCQGEYQLFTWEEAGKAVERLNREGYAGYRDWRYPVMPELASIVERRCFFPRVNEAVFPDTPSALFWSSMEKRGIPSDAYALDFGKGAGKAYPKSTAGAVRLVRGGPWWTPPQMMMPEGEPAAASPGP
jgi:hypothetical protein